MLYSPKAPPRLSPPPTLLFSSSCSPKALATPPPRLSSCNEEDKSAATPRPAAAIPAISNGPLSVEGLPTVLSLSENVLESSELDVVSLLLSPSKGAKDVRAEAIIGERMEESFENRDSGSSPCWYS